jgi:hypothetical protein
MRRIWEPEQARLHESAISMDSSKIDLTPVCSGLDKKTLVKLSTDIGVRTARDSLLFHSTDAGNGILVKSNTAGMASGHTACVVNSQGNVW